MKRAFEITNSAELFACCCVYARPFKLTSGHKPSFNPPVDVG